MENTGIDYITYDLLMEWLGDGNEDDPDELMRAYENDDIAIYYTD